MNQTEKKIINEYTNYLIRLEVNTTEIYMNIKTIKDINLYKNNAKHNLEKLEYLSIDHKLYDSNYKDFMLAMGKFAIGLDKSYKLEINDKDKKAMIDVFLDLNTRFEDLELKNIMKDAYVWK